MCFTEVVFSRLGDVDVWPSMHKRTWTHLHLCAFVFFCWFFLRFVNLSAQGRPKKGDNGAGPWWMDDECVHLMTTKA